MGSRNNWFRKDKYPLNHKKEIPDNFKLDNFEHSDDLDEGKKEPVVLECITYMLGTMHRSRKLKILASKYSRSEATIVKYLQGESGGPDCMRVREDARQMWESDNK